MAEIVKPGIDPSWFYYECDRCRCIFRFKREEMRISYLIHCEAAMDCPACQRVHNFNSTFLENPKQSYEYVKSKLET